MNVPAGETVTIPFVPEYTHEYVFQSTVSGNATYGYIFDANGNQLTSSYGGSGGQFKITYTLTAGQTYYLGVRWAYSSDSGTIPVLLTCATHSYTKNENGQFVCRVCGLEAPYTITLNQSLNVDVAAGETVRIPFVPEYTHGYIFQSTGSGNATYGYIYDANGNQLTSSYGGNGQFKITYTLTAGQTYYLRVEWYGSSNSGTIPVLLTYGDTHFYTRNESGQFVCACGVASPYSITLDQSLDVDVAAEKTIKIPFVPEHTHEYVFQSTGSGNTYGYIYDANGNQLASDDDSGGNSQFKITYTLTAGETYYLGVKWCHSFNSGVIPVMLTYGDHLYTKNESGRFECACGAISPYSIILNQSLSVDVAAGETIKIPFVPEYTHVYCIDQSTGSGYIYDADGNELTSAYSGNAPITMTYTMTAGETYYLGVNSDRNQKIQVTLTLGVHLYARNESGQNVCSCGLAAPYSITLNQSLDVDVAAGETITIPFVPEYTHGYIFRSTSSGGATYGCIYDADGKQLTSGYGWGGKFRMEYVLTAGQTYYLVVKWHSASNSGTIPVLLTSGNHLYTKNESGQFVCSGCGAVAPSITLNQSLDVELASGESVTIPFVPEYTHEYSFQTDEYGVIYDADGNMLTNRYAGGSPIRIAYTLTAGETYYLGVQNWSSGSSKKTIPILLTYGEHSYIVNESGQYVCSGCGTAGIILNEKVSVDVAAGETVRIPFVPEHTHPYVFRSVGSGDYHGYIYDADGNQLAGDDDSGGSGQFRIAYTLTAGRTYYLGIKWDDSDSSGKIPVMLTYGNHWYTKNESGQFVCYCGLAAPQIVLNQRLNVDVAAMETVKIPYVPDHTQQYVFRSTNTGSTYGYIYDAGGKQLASDDSSGGNNQFRIVYTLTAGETYYFGVRYDYSTNSGTIPVLLTCADHSYARNESGQYVCSVCGAVAPSITLNQILDVDVAAGETITIPFVPEYTHEYIFQSTSSGGRTYGCIYDADGKQLTSSYGWGGQFRIAYNLTAGETYYLGVKWNDSSNSGTIPVLLALGGHTYTQNESGQYICACGAASPYSITLGQSLDVDVPAGETVRIPFVPDCTHEYIFQTAGYGYLYDANGNQLTSAYPGGGPTSIEYTMIAGQTYYLGVYWGSNSSEKIPVLLTYGAHSYAKNESGQFVCACGAIALSITLNQSLDVDVPAGETVTIPFVPEYTHGYIFQSTSSGGGNLRPHL